jgi:hypothetical protein
MKADKGKRMKFWFFRHYWWFLLLVLLVLLVLIFVFASRDVSVMVALLGTGLSAIYFVQRQRMEELKLFREIFAECNDRYDQLNERLNDILQVEEDLKPEQVQTLMDYFNLCGEEYLYYQQGYLFPEVWQAWFNGITSVR